MMVDQRYIGNKDYEVHVRADLAHRIASVMVKEGLITYVERRDPATYYQGNVLEAVAGIVWPKGIELDRVMEDLDPMIAAGPYALPPLPTPAPEPGKPSRPEKPKSAGLRRLGELQLIFDDVPDDPTK
jgi:hypothetical protein